MMISRLVNLAIVSTMGLLVTATAAGCATGDPQPIPYEAPSQAGGTTPPSGESPAKGEPAPSTNGEPSIEAMFEPPTSTKATPNSLPGLWARSNSGSVEQRIYFSNDSLTLAKKCVGDGKISHATVKIRENADGSITILETKAAKSDPNSECLFSVQVELAEWKMCANTYENDCLRLEGTSLKGVDNVLGESTSSYQLDKWIKLSD